LRKRRDRNSKIVPKTPALRPAMQVDHGANALNSPCETIAVSTLLNNERISPDDIAAKVC
jgi:hypothetical protein